MQQVFSNFIESDHAQEIKDWMLILHEEKFDPPQYLTSAGIKTLSKRIGGVGDFWGPVSCGGVSTNASLFPKTPRLSSLPNVDETRVALATPDFVEDVRNKIAQKFGLESCDPSGDMFNFFAPNERLYAHTHPIVSGHCELRFNVLISKPEEGGEFVADNHLHDLNETDLVILNSNLAHWTTPVLKLPRMLISFGWFVPNKIANQICPNYSMSKADREREYADQGFVEVTQETIQAGINPLSNTVPVESVSESLFKTKQQKVRNKAKFF